MSWDREMIPKEYEQQPDVEQLLEYRELLIDILHRQGREIRYALGAGDEARHMRAHTEYLLPKSLVEWSVPKKDGETHIERDRTYSASYRRIGEYAARLLVLETDSVFVAPDHYATTRNAYRFTWDADDVSEAEKLPIEIVGKSHVSFAISPAGPVGVREVATFNAEQDDDSFCRLVNPFSETLWSPVSATDVDGLLRRTDEYGLEYDEEHPVVKAPQ